MDITYNVDIAHLTIYIYVLILIININMDAFGDASRTITGTLGPFGNWWFPNDGPSQNVNGVLNLKHILGPSECAKARNWQDLYFVLNFPKFVNGGSYSLQFWTHLQTAMSWLLHQYRLDVHWQTGTTIGRNWRVGNLSVSVAIIDCSRIWGGSSWLMSSVNAWICSKRKYLLGSNPRTTMVP